MRDYLYIWNDPDRRLVVASGIEFRDLVPAFTSGGLILLDHQLDVECCLTVAARVLSPALVERLREG